MTMVFLGQVEHDHIVDLPTSVVGRIEQVAHKGGPVRLVAARVAHILGDVQRVHLNLEQARRRAGHRRKDGQKWSGGGRRG